MVCARVPSLAASAMAQLWWWWCMVVVGGVVVVVVVVDDRDGAGGAGGDGSAIYSCFVLFLLSFFISRCFLFLLLPSVFGRNERTYTTCG